MKRKECPACAMEVDVKSKTCSVCGYEFSEPAKSLKWIAILLAIFFLIYLTLF
jgi:hypothetical protein